MPFEACSNACGGRSCNTTSGSILSAHGNSHLLLLPTITRLTLHQRFIATKILSKDVKAALTSQNVEFATVDDAAVALLKIVSNQDVIGRALAIVPRSIAPSGYLDIAIDDYDENTLLGKLQAGVTGATHRATVSCPF